MGEGELTNQEQPPGRAAEYSDAELAAMKPESREAILRGDYDRPPLQDSRVQAQEIGGVDDSLTEHIGGIKYSSLTDSGLPYRRKPEASPPTEQMDPELLLELSNDIRRNVEDILRADNPDDPRTLEYAPVADTMLYLSEACRGLIGIAREAGIKLHYAEALNRAAMDLLAKKVDADAGLPPEEALPPADTFSVVTAVKNLKGEFTTAYWEHKFDSSPETGATGN